MKRGLFGKKAPKHKLFGVPLAEIMAHPEERGKKCPTLMEECFLVLQEKSNLDVEGIFRQSASTKELDKLKELYSSKKQNRDQRLAALRAVSPISVACLVKQFLRELPEPLLTKPLSPLFVSAGRTEDPKERNANLRLLLKGLPAANKRVLRELVVFLQLVVAHSEKNRMTASNLGIVFAPTILFTELGGNGGNALADAGVANEVVADLIKNYDEILPDESRPGTPMKTPSSTPMNPRKKSRPSEVKAADVATAPVAQAIDSFVEQEEEATDVVVEYYDDGEEQQEEEEEEEGDDDDGGEEEVPSKEMLQAYLTGIQEWEKRKEKIKQDLIAYDAAFAREHGGRLPTTKEKLPMKEKYEEYKNAKAAIETLKAEYEKNLALCTEASADDILPSPYCNQSISELNKSLSDLKIEKRNVRVVLSKWIHEFAAKNHRPPTEIDYAPVQDTVTQYGRIKETIAMITKYLESHPQEEQ